MMDFLESAKANFNSYELAEIAAAQQEVSDTRSLSALDLLVAWTLHVNKIQEQLDMPPSDDRAWWAQDLVAALFLRDFIQNCLAQLPQPIRAKLEHLVETPDEIFRSMTESDSDGLVQAAAQHETAKERWWWRRIPIRGPIRQDLLEYYR
jgi:hypothetical protein